MQRCVQNLRKESQRLLVHRRPSKQKPKKAPFQRICEHLPNSRHWYIEKIWFTDVHKFRKSSFLSRLLAGAPVNKESLALFAQVLYISLNQIFSIYYQCLGLGRCSQMCWKGAFSAFACLGACEQGAFDSLFSSFGHISESIILNISDSRNTQMLTDVLERSFFRLLLAWAPVNKELLALFAQVFSKSLI